MNPDPKNPTDIEPGQPWEVDLFRPEDAEGVVRLFLTVYGEGYPIRTFLNAAELIRENAAGRVISSVVRTPKGDIVGHNALFHSAPYTGIYESGAGLVHPAYRGGAGVFTAMGVHGQETAAPRFGVEVIFGEPVCNHPFAQKATAKQKWITRAVEVDLMPAAAYVQEKSASGRVTTLLDFRTLRPRPHRVYMPEAYEEALRFAYEDLDDEREWVVSKETAPPHVQSVVNTQVFSFAQVARLAVHETGADLARVIGEAERKLLGEGVLVIQVWLKASCPWIGQAVDALRSQGYFFGGALLRWFDDDGLLLQKRSGAPCWDSIQLHYDRAKRLLDYVRRDWSRTVGAE